MEYLSTENDNPEKKLKTSNLGKIFICLTGGAAIGISVLCLPFVTPAFRRICLPYVPATNKQIENVLTALKGRTGNLIDIGSGDGRIVFAAAKQGYYSDGVELNPYLVLYSKFRSIYLGCYSYTKFYKKDLWKFNLNAYSNIVIFGVEQMMNNLEEKLNKEISKDSCIIACRFPLPNWIPNKTIGHGVDTVWIYYKN